MTEDNFKKYLKEKKSAHLTDDFDKNMMFVINKHALNKSKDKKYLILMYLFFFSGLLLGYMIAVSYVDLEFLIGGNKIIVFRIILIIPLIMILLFLFEKIYKATLVRIGKGNILSI